MDKHALVRALCELLDNEIARATETAERTRAGATHEEARPENDKDTRALEQSYLARGQAQRVVDLQLTLQQIKFMEVRKFAPGEEIGISALIRMESGNENRWYFLALAGGGRKVTIDGVQVDIITPEAPLGRDLTGRCLDDEFTVRAGGRVVEWVICAVE
jgi:hypothetical protein